MEIDKYKNHFGLKYQKDKTQEVLNLLEEGKKYVRIGYNSSDNISYLGRISGQDNQNIYLLPYLVWENLFLLKDEVLQRIRLETKIAKPLPKINISPDPLSKGYLETFAKTTNYFNSLKIPKGHLREILFDSKIYIMPTKKEIDFFKTQLNSKK